MPKWVVACARCKRTFTYKEIDADSLELARRDPFHVISKPPISPEGDEAVCPSCKRELKIKACDLTYSYL